MYEIEVKARISNKDSVISTIEDLKGQYLKTEKQIDIYFNHPCVDFAKTGESVRLRTIKDIIILTYKGPKLESTVKTRKEIEVSMPRTEIDKMLDFLYSNGYKKVAEIKKDREYYKIKDFTISIDYVEGLGSFIEIEKISDDIEKSQTEILSLLAHFDIIGIEKRTYLGMILNNEN